LAIRKRTITIDTRLSAGKVESHFDVSNDMKRYFESFDLYSSYDADIVSVKGILNIPAVATVLPLAWITGADVFVDELDEKFALSMRALQAQYKEIYPAAPFRTEIKADRLVKSEGSTQGTALLFSGGLDSTYSLYRNMALKPRLVIILGVWDIPISDVDFQEGIVREYSDYARREGLDINFVRTNALELFYTKNDEINFLWERFQGSHEGNFWDGLGFSLGHLCQAAPLSYGRFNQMLVSAGVDKSITMRDHPFASSPGADESIAWADLRVRHEGPVYRHEKTIYLRDHLNRGDVKLRVCWSSPEYLKKNGLMNCGRCEKCLRTIAALAYSGVDPNKCGFKMDESSFSLMRFVLEGRLLTRSAIKLWWKPLQDVIPDEVSEDFHGSKSFFEWFKEAELEEMERKPRSSLHTLVVKLPYPVWRLYRRFYRSITPESVNVKGPIIPEKIRRQAE
jgi:hypothetical protein